MASRQFRRDPEATRRRQANVVAREQVRIPALALFLAAAFWASALVVLTAFNMWQLSSGIRLGRDDGLFSRETMLVVRMSWSGLMLVVSVVIAIGALRMYQLRNRRLAWCAAILSVIPCLAPCYIGALPLGIWAILVLRRPDVAAAFE